jgi:hypothetical protein
MGIKRYRILRRFPKSKLTLVTKMHLKKVFLKDRLNLEYYRKGHKLACFSLMFGSGCFAHIKNDFFCGFVHFVALT